MSRNFRFVGTIVGIELIGVKKLMKKFEKNHGNN
jgi:hypothetical protein